MSFLNGTIFITSNKDDVYNTNLLMTKVISMDEDDSIQVNNLGNGGIVGTCLLPPIPALIAEIDGNAEMYTKIYQSHLLDAYQQQFISALIAYLYKKGNLLLFLPEMGNNTKESFINNMYILYGIHIGELNSLDPRKICYYDERCIPIWLNMIYTSRVISYQEYLYQLPLEAPLNNPQVIEMLIDEMRPYGNTVNERLEEISKFRKAIKTNPNVRNAIGGLY